MFIALFLTSLVMEIVTCRNPTTSDDGRLPLDFSSLFRGIRHFWSSLVVTFGRHFSPHIKNIFGKMFRTCRNYRPFVATSSRGRSGVVRRPEGEGVRSPRVVTCRHLSSLGRHLSSLIKNIFGKMFRTCRNYRHFVATIAPLSRGSSGVVRRPEGEVVRSPRVVTCRHLVVTFRHFWSSLLVVTHTFQIY